MYIYIYIYIYYIYTHNTYIFNGVAGNSDTAIHLSAFDMTRSCCRARNFRGDDT